MRDPVQPARQGISSPDFAARLDQDQEGRLEGVLSIVWIAQYPPADAQDHRPVPTHQRLEGPGVPLGEETLEELRVVQREDFIAILAAMDGLPVTVRLLDPPLHEFLPSTEELAHKEATVGLNPEESRLYEAALSWKEANPMLGTRGVRLGVIGQ